MEKLKNILTEMGYTTKAGIGSAFEVFAFDENGNSIACTLVGEELTTVSNKDAESAEHPEFFTVNINDRDAVIIAVEYAMEKDRRYN